MLSATTNAVECAQNCQNLPNSAQIQLATWTWKYHQKIKILVFSIYINSICRRGTKAYAYHSNFHYKNFSYAFFFVKKPPLYVNFSIPLCAKWCFFQGSIHLVNMRFCGHVLNSSRNKNLKSFNPYLLLTPKILSIFLPISTVSDLFGEIHFSTKKSMRTWGSNCRILKLPCWNINLQKLQLLIPWDLGGYNIQTSKFFFLGCFLVLTSYSKFNEN
jgi:hypothetical protein